MDQLPLPPRRASAISTLTQDKRPSTRGVTSLSPLRWICVWRLGVEGKHLHRPAGSQLWGQERWRINGEERGAEGAPVADHLGDHPGRHLAEGAPL